jgi:ppGpp synthetase/RelA/SpoT-type nucleotidyltranferase
LAPDSPVPLPARLTDVQIERVVQSYVTRDMARYEAFGRYLLSWRVKHPADLRQKLRKKRDKYSLVELTANPGEVVTDLAGCRVIVYEPRHEEVARDVVRRALPLANRKDADEGPNRKPTGYRATHLLVVPPDDPETLSIRGAICEVQITSLASHLFNELDHDVGYKQQGVPLSEELCALQASLRNGTRSVDEIAGLFLRRRAREVEQETTLITSPAELRHALEREFDRPLSGSDFHRLFQTLQQIIDPVTINALKGLGDPRELALAGAEMAKSLGLTDEADDVVHIMLGLQPTFSREFAAIVRGWRGPTTLLKYAILKAAEAAPATDQGDTNA